MSKQSEKGYRFEKLVAVLLQKIWPDAKRLGRANAVDVDGTPYWIECKHRKRGGSSIESAYAQATTRTDGRPCVVVSRVDRGPILVTVGIDTLAHMLRGTEQGAEGETPDEES